MRLDIILRTHDQMSLHNRWIDVTKKELVHRCFRALRTAIGEARREHEVNLTIVDDHSSDDTLALFSPHDDVHHLERTGNCESMLKAAELVFESDADLMYLVEDDYLHYPDALTEMVDTFLYFQKQGYSGGKPIALCLVDCPMEYSDHPTGRNGSEGRIFRGLKRPWRTNLHTGFSAISTPELFRQFKDLWIEQAVDWPYKDENMTINKIWENHAILFTPIIPLAYHMQMEHPFHPFDELWEKNRWSTELIGTTKQFIEA